VKVFADWTSNPNTDQAGTARCADAAVNFATSLRAVKSERIRLNRRFNFWRNSKATSVR
jgi:hypothetical protein